MQLFDIKEQYTRFSEVKCDEIRKLKEWIATQPHFPQVMETEVLLFYYACYCSVEMTKQVLDTNLTVRAHVPEFFREYDCDLPAVKRAMQVMKIVLLPQRTPEGNRVIISKIIDPNATHFHFGDVIKLYNLIYDMWLLEDGLRAGDIAVINMEGFTFGHLGRLNIILMRQFLFYMQEATPVRLKGIHFVNVGPVLDKLLMIITPFLKQEIKDILRSHNTMETFYEHVPKNILPKDYGGPGLSSNDISNATYKRLQANRQAMMAFGERFRINEKLRPEKSKIINDLFGIEGNFRRLDID